MMCLLITYCLLEEIVQKQRGVAAFLRDGNASVHVSFVHVLPYHRLLNLRASKVKVVLKQTRGSPDVFVGSCKLDCSGVELEKMIAKRDSEIVCLREEVQRLQLTLEEVQENTANHIACLQGQLANKIKDIEILEAKLLSQKDYERIKSELRTLREKKLASAQSHQLMSSARDRDEVFTQSSLAEEVAPSLADMEFKRETKTPSDILPLTEAVDHIHNQSMSSSRAVSSACQQSSYCLSFNDGLPIKSENSYVNSGLPFTDGWGGWTSDAEGRFLESTENQIETGEITQQVKELLKKHNIGQRVFGHYVLGRLQGTISELLAHPKPWNKLTTRGKEPFLRMMHFLSDKQNVLLLRMMQDKLQGSVSPGIHKPEMCSDESIRNILEQAKKELQSQDGVNSTRIQQNRSRNYGTYHDKSVARESEDIISSILEQARHEMLVQQNTKEHRGNSNLQVKQKDERRKNKDKLTEDHDFASAVSNTDFVQNIIRKVISEINAEDTCSKFCESQSWLLPWSTINSDPSAQGSQCSPFSKASADHFVSRNPDKELPPNVGLKFSPETDHVGQLIHTNESASESYKENWQPHQSQDESNCEVPLNQPLPDLQNGLEDQPWNLQFLQLDTLSITRKVKEILTENNLGQRLFGERVLSMTQGSVSDLLARPKPWTELSLRGREPFVRMYSWLKDPQNVHRLKTMKSLSHKPYWKTPLSCLSTGTDSASQNVLLDASASGLSCFDHPGVITMAKRPRVVLTSREKEVLNKAFMLEPYPSNYTTQRLALQLGLKPCTVTNWFYNHRSRLRYSVQDGRSTTKQIINSHPPDTEVTQSHSQDFTSKGLDSYLTTIKQEPIDVEISDVRMQEWGSYCTPEHVSIGTQSCRKVKLEVNEDVTPSSLHPEDKFAFL